jgi:hypothetical protein
VLTSSIPQTLLHEVSHTLGAVQSQAPHGTGRGHCTDGADIMCYADGGPRDRQLRRCGALRGPFSAQYDCNGDDYFNPQPAVGSYLASHWNLYNSPFFASCAELRSACGAARGSAGEARKPSVSSPKRRSRSHTRGRSGRSA